MSTSNSESKYFSAHRDVWAHGQVKSKLWLASELERVLLSVDDEKEWVIWIFGAWYSMTSFLLFSREKIGIDHIRGIDVDPLATSAADLINDRWVYESWRFKSFTKDCNELNYTTDVSEMKTRTPDLVVNTACEHFTSRKWFDGLPKGILVALQSNNMEHEEHHSICANFEEFERRYSLSHTFFKGQLAFDYENGFKFDRFMLIGRT